MIEKMNYKSEDKNDMDNVFIYKINEIIEVVNGIEQPITHTECQHEWEIDLSCTSSIRKCKKCGQVEYIKQI